VRPSAPPTRFVNINAPGGMTAMPANAFVARRPVSQNMVPVTRGNVAQAPLLTTAPLVRSDLGRIPITSAPGGAPPPAASNFYRTGRPPAGGGVGNAGALPGAGVTTAVPPATRPVPGSSGAGVINAAPAASRPVPTSPSGGNTYAVPVPAPDARIDSRNDQRNRQGAPQAVAPAGIPMPSGMAPAAVAVPPAGAQSPNAVPPAQPSLQRAPTRPSSPSLPPAYVAPSPVAVSPAMPPVNRQAPVSLPAPLVVRPAPTPGPAPQVAPAPAPAVVAPPAGANLQRADRPRPDKVDTDKTAPK
jgi:hypothetical protein